jgi:hypothetical protein
MDNRGVFTFSLAPGFAQALAFMSIATDNVFENDNAPF